MLRPHITMLSALLLCCLLSITSTHALHIQPRQEPAPSSTQAASLALSTSAASSQPPQSSGPVSSGSAQLSTTPALSSTTVAPSTIVFSTATATSYPTPSQTGLAFSNGTSNTTPDQLPLPPVISPAFAVAGVLLLANGAALTFVGYQRKWLYIPASVAALVSLSIIVLELYVVNPPVSDGVQGGYLVAAVLPPYLIAAAAFYIFAEIVEGFACIAGGFSFAMWLLCLSPGGLIKNTGGVAGLIAAFCVLTYAGYFSKYTRTYTMIISLAFTGSTMLVLGIDCFSKAGLKEFWVYNWSLNSRLFPLDTDTYPVTRGIKVEEAIIVVLTVIGIVSQFKLWNIIKKRRDEKAQARLQDEEDREHLEANLGRQVEEHNRNEKSKWEAVYGNKASSSSASIFQSTTTDSHYDLSGRSKHGSVHGSVVELTDLSSDNTPGSEKRDGKGITTVREVGDERHIRHERKHTLEALDPNGYSLERKPSVVETINSMIEDMDGQRINHKPTEPRVQALPFKIPTPGGTPDRDDANSLTTAAGGEALDDEDLPRMPAGRVRKAHEKFHSKHSSIETGSIAPDQDVCVPHIEEDRASSVDAVPDDELSTTDVKPSESREAQKSDAKSTVVRRRSASSLHKCSPREGLSVPAHEAAEKRKSMPALEQLEQAAQAASPDAALYTKPTTLADKLDLKTAKSTRAQDDVPTESPSRHVSLKKEFLPDGHSSIMQIYRTNEWAKHISTAEEPEMDKLAMDGEDAVGVEYGAEKVAPLNPEALSQTALNGQPVARAPSQASVTNPYIRKQIQRSASRAEDSPTGRGRPYSRGQDGSPGDTIKRASSGSRTHKSPASGSIYSTPGLSRSLSNMGSQILEESPTEDLHQVDSGIGSRPSSSANNKGPQYSKTLLGLRQQKLNTRMATTSFTTEAVDHPTLQHSVSASSLGHSARASRSSAQIYSNFDEPSFTPPNLTARASVDFRKSSAPSTAQSTAYGTPKHSARTSMADFRQRSTSNPLLTPMESQRISVDAKRLSIIQDDDDENASLSSRRQTLLQRPSPIPDDDDMPLSQRREMIRRASINSMSRTNSFTNMNISGTSSPIDPSVSRQRSLTSSPYALQNSSIIYDSHQPKRGSNFNPAAQESRLAEWRADMHRDASRERIPSFTGSFNGNGMGMSTQDESYGRIMDERRLKAEHEARLQMENAAKDRGMQEAMRSGAMQAAHRDKLRQMQRSASRAAA